MRKKLVLMPVLVFYCCLINAQPDNDSITSKTWYKKLNNAFGAIATGQGDAINMVNYGSFDPINGSFKFNFYGPIGSTKYRKVPFVSLNAGGQISGDNIGVLFNDSKFNSGMNIGAKIHFNIKPFIITNDSAIENINKKIKLLYDKTIIQNRKADYELDKTNLILSDLNDSIKLLGIIKRKNLIKFKIDSIFSSVKKLQPGDTIQLLKLTNEAVKLSKMVVKLDEDSLKTASEKAITDGLLKTELVRKNAINKIKLNINESYKTKREDIEMSVRINGFRFVWINVIGNFEQKKYYTFFDSLSFGKQFSKKKTTPYSLGLELSVIDFPDEEYKTFSGRRTHYQFFNLGLLRINTDNSNDLSTTELTNTRKYISGDSTHILTSKYNVYTKEIIEYKAWKLYMSYYYFFGSKNSFAFHTFADCEFRNTRQNPLNGGIGIVFGLKNRKDNSIINIETYIKFVDISRALPQEELNLIKRNEIGVRFGIPFSINLK